MTNSALESACFIINKGHSAYILLLFRYYSNVFPLSSLPLIPHSSSSSSSSLPCLISSLCVADAAPGATADGLAFGGITAVRMGEYPDSWYVRPKLHFSQSRAPLIQMKDVSHTIHGVLQVHCSQLFVLHEVAPLTFCLLVSACVVCALCYQRRNALPS
jgi:hypothetical protein